jgi:hypothetical protein
MILPTGAETSDRLCGSSEIFHACAAVDAG